MQNDYRTSTLKGSQNDTTAENAESAPGGPAPGSAGPAAGKPAQAHAGP